MTFSIYKSYIVITESNYFEKSVVMLLIIVIRNEKIVWKHGPHIAEF